MGKQKTKSTQNNYDFKSMDLLEVPVSLSFKQHYYFETNAGSILTLLNVILIICYSFYNISDLIHGENYSLVTNEFENEHSIIDFSNTPFSFTMLSSSGKFLQYDKKLLDYKIQELNWYYVPDEFGNPVMKNEIRNIKFELCKKIMNETNYFDFLSGYIGQENLCIKPNQNLILKGTSGDGINGFRAITIEINRCNNETMNGQCYDNNYINRVLDDYYFVFAYVGYTVDNYADSENLVKKKVFSNSITVTTNIMKKRYYWFKKGVYNL